MDIDANNGSDSEAYKEPDEGDGVWKESYDRKSKNTYFFHSKTKEVTWERPDGLLPEWTFKQRMERQHARKLHRQRKLEQKRKEKFPVLEKALTSEWAESKEAELDRLLGKMKRGLSLDPKVERAMERVASDVMDEHSKDPDPGPRPGHRGSVDVRDGTDFELAKYPIDHGSHLTKPKVRRRRNSINELKKRRTAARRVFGRKKSKKSLTSKEDRPRWH